MTDFSTMTREQLNDWYEREVGYRPDVDYGSELPMEELRDACESFENELVLQGAQARVAAVAKRAPRSSAARQSAIDGPYRVGEWVRLTLDVERVDAKIPRATMHFPRGTKGQIIEVPGMASAKDFRGMDCYGVRTTGGHVIYWEADSDAREGFGFADETELLSSDEIPSSKSAAEIQRESDGADVPGYGGLPDTLVALLVAIENETMILAACESKHYEARYAKLTAARKAFAETLLADDRIRALGDEEDEPKCEGCGEAPADECEPCYVVFTAESATRTGGCASGEYMYCNECIEQAQGGIRAGEGDGKCLVVRLKWVRFDRGVLTRFYRVLPPGADLGDAMLWTLAGASAVMEERLEADPTTEYRVTRWPFGERGLEELGHLTGFNFSMEDFDNAR